MEAIQHLLLLIIEARMGPWTTKIHIPGDSTLWIDSVDHRIDSEISAEGHITQVQDSIDPIALNRVDMEVHSIDTHQMVKIHQLPIQSARVEMLHSPVQHNKIVLDLVKMHQAWIHRMPKLHQKRELSKPLTIKLLWIQMFRIQLDHTIDKEDFRTMEMTEIMVDQVWID
jgi:hypothetical protein